MSEMIRQQALDLIAGERERQQHMGWSEAHDDKHSPAEWLAIIQHELGDLADAVLNGTAHSGATYADSMRKVGATAAAALEAYLRAADPSDTPEATP